MSSRPDVTRVKRLTPEFGPQTPPKSGSLERDSDGSPVINGTTVTHRPLVVTGNHLGGLHPDRRISTPVLFFHSWDRTPSPTVSDVESGNGVSSKPNVGRGSLTRRFHPRGVPPSPVPTGGHQVSDGDDDSRRTYPRRDAHPRRDPRIRPVNRTWSEKRHFPLLSN